MANPITFNTLTVFATDTDATSFSTLSVSPAAGKVVLVGVQSTIASGTGPNEPTLSGNSLTWVKVDGIAETNQNKSRLTVFRGMGVAPTAGVVTANFAGQSQTTCGMVVVELSNTDSSGTNGSGAIVQTNTAQVNGTNSGISVTLSAFSNTNNATMGFFAIDRGIVMTVGSGFTDAGNTGGAASSLQGEFRNDNDTTVDASWVSGTTRGMIVGIEIKAAVIYFDAASNSGYQTAQSTYSWSHTCTGSNRYLVVGVSMLSVGGSSVTGITYNGVAMTLIGAIASVSGAVRSEMWGLIAPATGSNTIAVTLSGSLDSTAGATSFQGVHQTSPIEGYASATATNVGAADATVNVTTVADNDWVIDTVASSDTAITIGSNQISRWNVTGTLGSGAGSTEAQKTPTGSVTMNWTNVAALATWSIGAVAIRDINASTLGLVTSYMKPTLFWGG